MSERPRAASPGARRTASPRAAGASRARPSLAVGCSPRPCCRSPIPTRWTRRTACGRRCIARACPRHRRVRSRSAERASSGARACRCSPAWAPRRRPCWSAWASASLGGLLHAAGSRPSIMRLTDILMAFPYILLAIAIVAGLGPGLRNAMIAIAIVGFPIYTRLVRGVVLSRARARVRRGGARARQPAIPLILRRHILPHLLSPVIVAFSLDVGAKILATAGLSLPRSRHPAAHRGLGQHAGDRPPVRDPEPARRAAARAWRSSSSCWRSTWSATPCAICSIRGQRCDEPQPNLRSSSRRYARSASVRNTTV